METTHCRWCGGKLMGKKFPKTCRACEQLTYDNPTPVAVLIFNADDGQGNTGPLMVKRAIAPGKDRWALPGGFVEGSETFEEAAARECFEETGFRVDPSAVMLRHSFNTGHGQILVFCEVFDQTLEVEEYEDFTPTSEVSEISVFRDDLDICFESHRLAAVDWFGPFR